MAANQCSILFLKGSIVLIGTVSLAVLLWFPQLEGRATNLNLFSIYLDPFILYGYASAVPFFICLYKAFNLLGYIGQKQTFSSKPISALRTIKKCAILLSLLIVLGAVYIRPFHNVDDDPAGFLALSMISTFLALIVAASAAEFEKILKEGINLLVMKETQAGQ